MKKNILVLGAGAWGTAIANLLAENQEDKIFLWAFEKSVVNEINTKRLNSCYLPKIKLNHNVEAINNFKNIVVKYLFIVVPSQFVFTIVKKYLKQLTNVNKNKISLIICSKGFDVKKKMLLSEVLKPLCTLSRIVILSGPSFARLVAEKKPTAVTIASKNLRVADRVRGLLNNKNFRVYINKDIIGVQVNGAIKNILAIAAGITDGLGYGENARAAIICRGLKEIEKVSKALGGKNFTSLSLSGIGDILLTCTSVSSRNYSFGLLIGKGMEKNKILKNQNTITEGVENAKVLYMMKKKYDLDTPILDSVYQILVKKYTLDKVVSNLFKRPLKNE